MVEILTGKNDDIERCACAFQERPNGLGIWEVLQLFCVLKFEREREDIMRRHAKPFFVGLLKYGQ